MPDDGARSTNAVGLGVGAALLGYAMLAVGFICIGIPSQTTDNVGGLWITEAMAIALPALIWVRASGTSFQTALGLRLPRARWFGIAALTAIVNQPVVSMLTFIAQSTLPRAWVVAFEVKNLGIDTIFTAHPYSMLAAVALSAPLGEEIFFRGFALPACANSMKPLFAALLTAILFSAMHADPVGALGLFEIGFWLAVLRWGSGSIFPAMLGHAVNNAIAGVWFLLGLQSANRAPPEWATSLGIDNPDAPPPTWVIASGAVLLICGALLAAKVFSSPSPTRDENEGGASPGGSASAQIQHSRALPLWLLWGAAMIPGVAWLYIHRAALLHG